MDKSQILKGFNDHFIAFLDDVQNVFENDSDILATKNALLTAKKTNPKLIIKMWTEHIVKKYEKEITEGNISFFIEKNYENDLKNLDNNNLIMNKINALREPIRQMNPNDQEKSMKYIQNLTKLSKIYFS